MENNEKEREIITTEEDMDKNDPENNENKTYDESRIYYVYEHIRLDKMEPFYIGKGKGERAYELYRNDHHDAIVDEYGHAVVIIADNLTEEEAYWLERDTIEDYVFNLGYGIDIKGHNDYDHNLPHLTNCTWGGEGASGTIPWNKGKKMPEEAIKKRSEAQKGKKRSKETKRKISEAVSGEKNGMWGKKGKDHPMFGKNAFVNKTEEEMEEIRRKKSNSMKGKNAGEKSGMWGKKGKDNPTYGEKSGMWGKPAANRRKVICITTCKKFDCIKDACDWYNVAKSSISNCCKGKYKHAGKLQDGTPLQWMYLEDYNNESNEYNKSNN